jgi:TetR/AcrR family transcriptional regulator
MPRPYRLGERAAQMAATRDRIVEAAIDLYTEVGISAATLGDIGRRADVAPGTFRKHFPSREDLERAVMERLVAEAPLPDSSIFDGAGTIEERLARVIAAGGAFMDGARRLYRMWLREPLLSPAWLERGAEYGQRWDLLMRTALGPLADDDEAVAVLRGVLDPEFFDRVAAGRRSTPETAALITAVIAPWFASRRPSASGGRSG